MTPGAAKLYPRWMVLSLGGAGSSLELLTAPIHTHPAQLGLQQPGIDRLVQLLSPLGEKKGER